MEDAVHEVVHVDEVADRGAVAPDLDLAAVGRLGDLARKGGGGLLAAAAPGALGAVAVLEAGDADLHPGGARVGEGHALGVELLPAVVVVGRGGVGAVLVDLRVAGPHVVVDADGGREEVAPDASRGGLVAHVGVDEHAVVHDLRRGAVDEAHAAHLGGELEHGVGRAAAGERQGADAVLAVSEVSEEEVVGRGRGELGPLAVGAADPPAAALEFAREVGADETAGAADESCLHGRGGDGGKDGADSTRNRLRRQPGL